MRRLRRFIFPALFAAGIGFLSQPSSANEPGLRAGHAFAGSNTVQRNTLADIVQLVRTKTEFYDRSVEINIGSGFVLGRYFITVYHNLLASRSRFVRQTVSVDGVPLAPIFIDKNQDIAVFELPEELCRRYCNQLRIAIVPTLEPGRPVYWVRKVESKWELKESTISNLAVFDRLRSGVEPGSPFRCSDNLVVEIEEPFVPGSSGAPVVDALTGQIIGVIQGSFESNNERTGFFKPIHCLGFQQALYPSRRSASSG
jgi:hypothetical protein